MLIMISWFVAHPKLQPVNSTNYVIAGNPFILNCTATNDVESPNDLTFKWLQESTEINNTSSQWNIIEVSRDAHKVTSQIIISILTVDQHNGTYVCMVDNNENETAVNQTTNVVVES